MTVAGMHSVAELEDLVKAKQYTVSQLTNAYKAFADKWQTMDRIGHDDWLNDWRAFAIRYEKAILSAKAVMTIAAGMTLPNALIPAEGTYQEVLRACTRQTDGSYSKGDLQDLHNRLSQAREKEVEYPKMPQPGIHTDLDLTVHDLADSTLKGAQAVSKDNLPLIVGGTILGTLVAMAAIRR